MRSLGRLGPVAAGALVLALLAAALVAFWPGGGTRTLTADFPRTVSLYEGSDVRILGVPVGKVETVTPRGTVVRVELSYDDQYQLPADAQAVIVAPSIVGDRYVQLTPAFEGGEALPDGARLSVERTATPLELDEIFGSLNELNIALGPEQTNRPVEGGVGPLTRLLDSTARNFGGQGVQFNQTIQDFSQLTKTLSDNEDELFGSMEQVQQFTSTLARNDDVVRRFNDSLAGGAEVLAGERQELARALRDLGVAMAEIRTFVRDNKASLSTNIKGLNRISKTLVKRRDALDEILRVAPAALNNLFLAGNSEAETLDTRDNISELLVSLEEDPVTAICTLAGATVGGERCDSIAGAVGDIQEGLPALPAGRAGALEQGAPRSSTTTGEVDRSLGGLLEVEE